MDPNEALRQLRAAVSLWEDTVGAHQGAHIDAGSVMRDVLTDLDAWLTHGGFLPDAWQRVSTENATTTRF